MCIESLVHLWYCGATLQPCGFSGCVFSDLYHASKIGADSFVQRVALFRCHRQYPLQFSFLFSPLDDFGSGSHQHTVIR